MTAASCKKNCVLNILIWLSGRAVKTQLQIVLIRLFVAMDGYPISVKNEFLKNIFLFVFYFKSNQQWEVATLFSCPTVQHFHTHFTLLAFLSSGPPIAS